MNDRKRHVLLTAKRLFVENSFALTSVQDILDQSNISKGTFYNYFPSKNACLIAILEEGRQETLIRRQELLINEDPADIQIFVKQIAVRFQVNVDYNLLPIFEAVFYSSDLELRRFAKKQHLTELTWLATRIIDLFGDKTSYYAADLAVLLTGMIQHMTQVSSNAIKDAVEPLQIVEYAIQQLQVIVPSIVKNKKPLISPELFSDAIQEYEQKKLTKDELIAQLQCLATSIEKSTSYNEGRQYINFLIEELQQAHSRKFIMKAVMKPFHKSFIDSPYESICQDIIANLWIYLHDLTILVD